MKTNKTNTNTLVESLNQVLEAAQKLDARGIKHTSNSIKDTVRRHTKIAIAKTIVVSARAAEITNTSLKILRSRNGRYILGQLVKTYVLNKIRECKEELASYEAEQEANTQSSEEDNNEYTI